MKVQSSSTGESPAGAETSPEGDSSAGSLDRALLECDGFEWAVLNHLVHRGPGSLVPTNADRGALPDRVLRTLEELEDRGLVVSEGEGYRVPKRVLRRPAGPGRRWDTVPGLWHRLPEPVRETWLETLEPPGTENDPGGLPEDLLRPRASAEDRRVLESLFEGSPWRSREALDPGPPTGLDELFRWAADREDPPGPLIHRGLILPTWNAEREVTGFLRHRLLGESSPPETPAALDAEDVTDETKWERRPFGSREQLKILLVVLDALPFRTTLDGYPHLFDVKDAERITGWDRSHLHGLIHRARELGLIVPGEDRFYMSSSSREWEVNPSDDGWWFTRVPTADTVPEDNGEFRWTRDFTAGRLLAEVLRVLDEYGETGVREPELVEYLSNRPAFRGSVLAGADELDDFGDRVRAAVHALLDRAHEWGFVDRLREDPVSLLRVNDRGRQYRRRERSAPSTSESDLPVILQPDGQLMIPLQAPLENFRHVNPFALLVNVDQMVQYKLDRQSLVQALNDGWDPSDFRAFLEENASGIPDPVRDVFADVGGDVEQMTHQRVHHLLVFENGSTAANALNALSNYNPTRVDENKVLLQSKTKEETIRRNLARSGIRLRSTTEKGTLSPLQDDPESPAG